MDAIKLGDLLLCGAIVMTEAKTVLSHQFTLNLITSRLQEISNIKRIAWTTAICEMRRRNPWWGWFFWPWNMTDDIVKAKIKWEDFGKSPDSYYWHEKDRLYAIQRRVDDQVGPGISGRNVH